MQCPLLSVQPVVGVAPGAVAIDDPFSLPDDSFFLFLWESEREKLPSEWEKREKKMLQALPELYMPRLFLLLLSKVINYCFYCC